MRENIPAESMQGVAGIIGCGVMIGGTAAMFFAMLALFGRLFG